MLSTKQKQKLLILLGLLIAFSSVGFSFNQKGILWFWQRYPFIPILLIIVVCYIIFWWLKLEIENQRLQILVDYNNSRQNEQSIFNKMLSKREIEVLGLINSGLSNKEIAQNLHVSLSTVKTHINNIYKILEVKNRREAIDKL
jgi:DNA-binding CsgD family transcriptional regulator